MSDDTKELDADGSLNVPIKDPVFTSASAPLPSVPGGSSIDPAPLPSVPGERSVDSATLPPAPGGGKMKIKQVLKDADGNPIDPVVGLTVYRNDTAVYVQIPNSLTAEVDLDVGAKAISTGAWEADESNFAKLK